MDAPIIPDDFFELLDDLQEGEYRIMPIDYDRLVQHYYPDYYVEYQTFFSGLGMGDVEEFGKDQIVVCRP